MRGGQRSGKTEKETEALLERLQPSTLAHAKDGTRYRLEHRATTTTIHRAESKADRRMRLKAEKRTRGKMTANHLDIVQTEFNRQPPFTGSFGNGAEPESSPAYQSRLRNYFEFQQRVLSALARSFPAERWGYLRIGGQNITLHLGFGVKVGRVCAPDGQLYKIGHDVPTGNGPAWEADGIVQNDHGGKAEDYYLPFEGAVAPVPDVPPSPIPFVDLVVVLQRLDAQASQLTHLENLVKQLADLVTDSRKNAGLEYSDLAKRTEWLATLIKAARAGSVRYLGPLSLDALK